MTAIDINRGTTNVALPSEVSSEIWANILEQSAFMQLARRINMPGNGVTIQTITGEPQANWGPLLSARDHWCRTPWTYRSPSQ